MLLNSLLRLTGRVVLADHKLRLFAEGNQAAIPLFNFPPTYLSLKTHASESVDVRASHRTGRTRSTLCWSLRDGCDRYMVAQENVYVNIYFCIQP